MYVSRKDGYPFRFRPRRTTKALARRFALLEEEFMQRFKWIVFVSLLLSFIPVRAVSQNTGSIRGVVRLSGDQSAIHGVPIRIIELGTTVISDDAGAYEFTDLSAGSYSVLARMDGFRETINKVTVGAGATATSDFELRLLGVREEITVTASGQEEVAYESFKVTTTLDSVELAENAHTNLGEALENEPGIAKRSFGPGPSRPVIRGFDGDRVLILQDGAKTGSLSSQSGDHAEPIDPLSLERLEVVKGPSTLLYGSNALGGVVNAMTGHDHAHPGLRGSFTAVGGTANEQGGGNASFEYGRNALLLWGGGGAHRTGNYQTPIGEIFNSQTRIRDASTGVGLFGNQNYASAGYELGDARYGIPIGPESPDELPADEEIVDLTMRRHSIPVRFGRQNMESFLEAVRVALNYNKYHHEEINRDEVDTVFDNKQFTYRSSFEQKKSGVLSGSFGFEGWWRDYKTTGEEAIAPPVVANAISLFGLEQLDLGTVRLQFGGRYENTRYDPNEMENRSFDGLSGSAGIQVPVWEGGNFLLNYTHSARTPALEELYNNGPHPGNLTFEVGNPGLKIERGDGVEVSLRQSSSRVHGEANFFYYNLGDFVYLAPTGEIEDGLNVADYAQANSRFLGGEFGLDLGLHRNIWINLGLDAVKAELTDSGTPLPRIPPLRGRVGFEAQYKNLRIRPQLLLASAQKDIFPLETRTAGYAVVNVNASYTVAQNHLLHIFSVDAFNLADRFYQNHLSFIKDLAPEIGRGVRFSYSMRLF
jgi:iron complex outermembrane recepter protein